MPWIDDADDLMSEAQKDQAATADSESWDPKERGDKLTGTLVRGDIIPTKYGDAHVMFVRDAAGKVHTVWCTATVLKSQLDEKHPAKDKGVQILFGGMKQPSNSGGNAYKSFTMIVEETDHQYWMDISKAHFAKQNEATYESAGSGGVSSAPFSDDDVPY